MHVEAKRMATAGLLVAFSVIMMYLSSVIETSSLFFIAAASFCVGSAIREWGLRIGFAFLIASVVLNFLIVPDKLHCFTFAGMGSYIWAVEWLWNRIAEAKKMKNRTASLWIGKYIVFNLLYVPVLFCAPRIIFTGKINGLSAVIFLFLGQIALCVYDMAYRYYQARIWSKLRIRILGEDHYGI